MSIAIMVILCLLISVILSQIVNPIRRVAFILKGISRSSQEITTNIKDIHSSAIKSADGANKTNASATELANLSDRLKLVVNQFKC